MTDEMTNEEILRNLDRIEKQTNEICKRMDATTERILELL